MSTPARALTLGRFHELLGEVYEARAAVAAERSSPVRDRNHSAVVQGRLLLALENYVTALTVVNCPVPYRIRAELNLCRSLHAKS
jgi:hypothetical protein